MKGAKIFLPPMFSLSHMATVQVAIKLFNEFRIEVLAEAYRGIKDGTSLTSEDSKNYPGYNRARKKLLLIPCRLRETVMEAIHGLDSGVEQWKKEHFSLLELDEIECIFYWRCDGTVDSIKTAEQLVMDSSMEIRKRFRLACIYCFEEMIQALWADMQATGKAENLETVDCTIVRFWVEWLRGMHSNNWKKEILYNTQITHPVMRFNSFFPSLQPKVRDFFYFVLKLGSPDDVRLCLYSLTHEEENKLLRTIPKTLLFLYLQWPLRSFFIETARKLWKYMDGSKYRQILYHLLGSEVNRDVFDFYDFFECFWNDSPSHLRESAKKKPELAEKIESCFAELEERRKKISLMN